MKSLVDNNITIVITSSPSRRHPSTAMIKKTIRLLRLQLDSNIVILLDDVRPEQEYLRDNYENYKQRLIKWSSLQDNIKVVEFNSFQHQSGMLRSAIDSIETEQILFIEHDFPVVGDIPWNDISSLISEGRADLVRFYLEPRLEPAHDHLFLDKQPFMMGAVPVIRTGQWSQRPHLASLALYRRVMKHFTAESRTYIEDGVHGFFGAPFVENPTRTWKQNKLCIYHPLSGTISRCRHLDGRLDEQKYEMIS